MMISTFPSYAGTNTNDATAAASDVLSGKTAYVKGSRITGTITSKAAATITPTTTNQTIAAGQYLSGDQTISGDANLVAGNIKKDVSLFGVSGSFEGGSSVGESYGSYVKWEPILYYYADSTTTTLTQLNSSKYVVRWFADNIHFIIAMSTENISICIMDNGYPRIISSITVSSMPASYYGGFEIFDDGVHRLICVGGDATTNLLLIIIASDWSMSFASSTVFNTNGYFQSFSSSGSYVQRGSQIATLDLATGNTTNPVMLSYSTYYQTQVIWVDDTHFIGFSASTEMRLYSFNGSTITAIGNSIHKSLNGSDFNPHLLENKTRLIQFVDYTSDYGPTALYVYPINLTTGLSEAINTSNRCRIAAGTIIEKENSIIIIGTGSVYPNTKQLMLTKPNYLYSNTKIGTNLSYLNFRSIAKNNQNEILAASVNLVGLISPIENMDQAQGAYLWRGVFIENRLIDITYNNKTYRAVE